MIKNIFSAILAIIVSISTYPFSFLPTKIDTDFTITGNAEYTETVDNESIILELNQKTGWFNYFGISYSSNAPVKGIISYGNGFGKVLSEEFFLEKSTDGTFYSFIDNVRNKTKARNVISIEVKSADKSELEFMLNAISTFNREIPKKEIFVSNEYLKFGINLNWGGALSYLEDLDSNVEVVKKDGKIHVDSNASQRYGAKAINKNVNLINRHDTGRLVQQSFYGVDKADGYNNGVYMGNVWSYNPVQGGNQFDDCSKLVDLRIDGNSLYVKCRPMDWACHADQITPSYMESIYALEGNKLHTSCRFVDYSGYDQPKKEQELPAFYCVEPLNNFVYCENGEPKIVKGLGFWAEEGYPKFTSSEKWSAFIGEFDDSFGIGLYVPDNDTFLAGVYDRGLTTMKDPSNDVPTSYIAVVERYKLECYVTHEYDFYIATGNTEEMRATFNAIK